MTLVSTAGQSSGTSPAQARKLAQQILAERRFQPPRQPRPFRRPLTWLGRQLTDVFGPLIRPIVRQHTLFGVLAILAFIAFVAYLVTLGRKRVRLDADRRLLDAPSHTDPAELDAAADRARAAGHHDLALRLRFKAGLMRLERAGRIGPSDGRTNGDVRRQLQSDTFTELADRFDEVVYGGDAASAADDDRARDGWRSILAGSDR